MPRKARFSRLMWSLALAAGAATVTAAPAAAEAWQPTKPVTFIIPAGTGGGADQMARFIQGIVAKHNLMSQPFIVINKAGGAGAEGFLEIKGSKGDPHKACGALGGQAADAFRIVRQLSERLPQNASLRGVARQDRADVLGWRRAAAS